jgi:nitrate reductase gamma subunit
MGILLSLAAYLGLAIFLGASLSRFLTLWRTAGAMRRFAPSAPGPGPLPVLKMAADIFFLARLLKINDFLWIGEWLFHCSLFLVVLRHLRYVLTPVPDWIWFIQPFGLVAGYLLPVSLVYIFAVKAGKGEGYFPFYNVFLLILLFLAAVTGILMSTVFKTDTVNIKAFMTGIFTFSPVTSPDGILFSLHFFLFLLLLACLPAHIFTAPFVMVEARKREKELETLIREE